MIIGGEANNGLSNPLLQGENNDFGFVMLDANGAIAPHFGVNGFLRTDFNAHHDDVLTMALCDVVTDSSGKVLSFTLYAAGFSLNPADDHIRYAAAKYASLLVEITPP